jgi:hypothetical protein
MGLGREGGDRKKTGFANLFPHDDTSPAKDFQFAFQDKDIYNRNASQNLKWQ